MEPGSYSPRPRASAGGLGRTVSCRAEDAATLTSAPPPPPPAPASPPAPAFACAPRFPLPHTYEHGAPGASPEDCTPFQVATLPARAAALPPAAARHIVFVLDATGSMEPYLATAKYAVQRMMSNSHAAPPQKGAPSSADAPPPPSGAAPWDEQPALPTVCSLIFFRDHTDRFVTRRVGPTADVSVLTGELAMMRAAGGGDTPEATAEALRAAGDAIRAAGYANAATVVVLLTDAPPHGLAGASGDSYPDGGPEGSLVDIMEQCDAFADLNARMVVVIAGRAAGALGYDVNTVWRGLASRASPQDVPIVVPLEAKGHAADMLCELVTGIAASEAEDAQVVERIAALEAQLLAAQPTLPEAERDAKVAALLSAVGRRVTTLCTDGEAAFDDGAAAALAVTPSLAAAREALRQCGFGAKARLDGEAAGAWRRAASSPATRVEGVLSPMSAADVRRSKGKSSRDYPLHLMRAMAAAEETVAEE